MRELLSDEVLDLLAERSKDEAGRLRLTGEGSMLGQLVRAVLERALEAERPRTWAMTSKTSPGTTPATGGAWVRRCRPEVGPVRISVPRDRAGTFEPVLVLKRAGRVAGGLDDMLISLYVRGMGVRDILHHLNQVYGAELSHEQASRITDQVIDEVKAWHARPLDPGRFLSVVAN